VVEASSLVGVRIKTTDLGADMFRGLHEHNLDAKGRVSLPVRFREILSPGGDAPCRFVLTTGLEKCLVLYPEPVWTEFEAKLATLSQFDPAVVQIRRIYMAGATECTLDKHGRVLVPPMLREFAKLEKEAVWAGMGKTIEIWSKASWSLQVEQARHDPAAVAAALASLGI
jgi:MraZ protein